MLRSVCCIQVLLITVEQKSIERTILRNVDWWTVILYLAMVIAGVISIYAASYDFDNASILSFNEFSGKQIRWIGLALVLGLVILLTDARIFEDYAYPFYLIMVVVLILTIFISPNIKGSHSWIKLGSMSLQPAEFAKCATALALGKLFSAYNFQLTASRQNFMKALALIFIPILIILAQSETGSALAYLALFFVLYREGMSGLVLLAALCAVVFFVVAMKYSTTVFMGIPTGEALVMALIMIMMVLMTSFYARSGIEARNLFLGFAAGWSLVWVLSWFGISLPGYTVFFTMIGAGVVYIVLTWLHRGIHKLSHVAAAVIMSLIFLFSVNYAFNNILQPHQQQRINVSLGLVEDLQGDGYNVNQSKIAIGSGGFLGKGFLQGTQTKLKYVPEQHTDFIFCTIGEEEGFVGTIIVIGLFLTLIVRVVGMAERQPTPFGRVYGYCVASYFIFHLAINVGMVLGLCPVIGIPLPFFSYGGSSLWGFTLLLFILIRLDAARRS